MKTNIVYNQDCIEGMSELPDESIDTVITDPPYGLSFMGKEWDDFTDNEALQRWTKQWTAEALRVAKPGAIMLCFGGTRTWHRIACGIEDTGWEIRDTVIWAYGSGFPKSHNISKAVMKKVGDKGEKVGEEEVDTGIQSGSMHAGRDSNVEKRDVKEPTTKQGKKWEGYGTALKPAWEPIIMAMKPYENTYAENALEYDVAGLNIDGARVPSGEGHIRNCDRTGGKRGGFMTSELDSRAHPQGRFPANLIHDGSEEVEACFPESKSSGKYKDRKSAKEGGDGMFGGGEVQDEYANEKGSASRYFKRIKYSAKASKKERNKGLDGFKEKVKDHQHTYGVTDKKLKERKNKKENHPEYSSAKRVMTKNNHPTVKPLALMRYLVELTKMPNEDQIYLDPFIGSGTTGMAVRRKDRNYIGYETEEEYVKIARARIQSVENELI